MYQPKNALWSVRSVLLEIKIIIEIFERRMVNYRLIIINHLTLFNRRVRTHMKCVNRVHDTLERDSVARLVREVLTSDPALYKCLEMGIVNYSRVASRLRPVLSKLMGRVVSEESIKMALIRLRSKAGETHAFHKKEVLRVLSQSRVEVKTGVVIVIMGINRFLSAISAIAKISPKARFLAVMQSGFVATIVLDENSVNEFLSLVGEEGIIEIQRDQAAIVVVSPVDIMWVPGVVAYITSILAQNSINIVHIESCYTDTVIVVSKDDLLKAFNVLMKHIEIARSLVEGSADASGGSVTTPTRA